MVGGETGKTLRDGLTVTRVGAGGEANAALRIPVSELDALPPGFCLSCAPLLCLFHKRANNRGTFYAAFAL